MRRSGSGRMALGVVSSRGVGRLVFWVIIGYERDDLVGFEFFAAAEVTEFYEEGYAGYRAAGVLDELAHGACRASCCEEVVGDEDAGSFRDSVGVGFEGV